MFLIMRNETHLIKVRYQSVTKEKIYPKLDIFSKIVNVTKTSNL